MAQKSHKLAFVQITGAKDELFGLTADGSVWRYVPAKGKSFAYWTRLTDYGKDPREARLTGKEENRANADDETTQED